MKGRGKSRSNEGSHTMNMRRRFPAHSMSFPIFFFMDLTEWNETAGHSEKI